MCRLVAYLGHDLLMEDVLIKPVNSLLIQSKHAKESHSPTNGDGYGVSWYNPNISDEPGLFTSVFPAWNDRNLRHLAAKIQSPCFFAHVRAATTGSVANSNCHPFISGPLQFMHNGGLGHFIRVKRHLRHCLDDDIYHGVQGETDSEHLFALLLQHAKNETLPLNSNALARLLERTIRHALDLVDEFGDSAPSFLNLCISNGHCLIASRVHSKTQEKARSLHYSTAQRFEFIEGKAHMIKGKHKGAVLISSEVLNDFHAEWRSVPENTIIIVDESLNIQITDFKR